MAIIGVDLDNTVISYDVIFDELINELCIERLTHVPGKKILKDALISIGDNEYLWQKVQGEVYGKRMHNASLFPGFILFAIRAFLNGDKLIFISHKTKFAHHDSDKTNLRDAATNWLKNNVFSMLGDCDPFLRERVIYADTRDEKVSIIKRMKCDVFIDDLPEVLIDDDFPENTKKILFVPHVDFDKSEQLPYIKSASWGAISEYIYGPINNLNILKIINTKFPELGIVKVDFVRSGINSSVAKLYSANGPSYALKMYPSFIHDTRNRLKVEWTAIEAISKSNFLVPKPIDCNASLNWGIYEWIEGRSLSPDNEGFLTNAMNFIVQIQNCDEILNSFNEKFLASEACLNSKELLNQISSRLTSLKKFLAEGDVKFFLENEFEIFFKKLTSNKYDLLEKYSSILPNNHRILSPSDFGSHNMILDYRNNIYYYDFEYFGWDDPVKMVADFYWHPGMNLSEKLRQEWIIIAKEAFKKDEKFAPRLDLMLPFYGLKWCLIILNIFKYTPNKVSYFASAEINDQISSKLEQFEKSRSLLNTIREIYG